MPPTVSKILDTISLKSYFLTSYGTSGWFNSEAEAMTKADLVERVTAQISRTAGPMISKKDCARVVDAFLEAVKESLQHQENIEVRGFGTFKIRRRKTRMARNPRTGSPVEVSARPVPVFKPSKELRALVAGVEMHELHDAELSEAD
jgi:integration host factor subunit beta